MRGLIFDIESGYQIFSCWPRGPDFFQFDPGDRIFFMLTQGTRCFSCWPRGLDFFHVDPGDLIFFMLTQGTGFFPCWPRGPDFLLICKEGTNIFLAQSKGVPQKVWCHVGGPSSNQFFLQLWHNCWINLAICTKVTIDKSAITNGYQHRPLYCAS